jgi:hypothetical protein
MAGDRGYVGLTDPDWYGFLSAHPHVDEVNFWQPHGGRTFRAIAPGSPFFFKLRAPLRGIAGFGYFERFESLPAWLAWESFGEMNGASDFESMVDRIVRLRGDGDARTGDFQIGCIMITAPVFFAPDEWVAPLHAVLALIRYMAKGNPESMEMPYEDCIEHLASLDLGAYRVNPAALIRNAEHANFVEVVGDSVRPRIPLLARIAAVAAPEVGW